MGLWESSGPAEKKQYLRSRKKKKVVEGRRSLRKGLNLLRKEGTGVPTRSPKGLSCWDGFRGRRKGKNAGIKRGGWTNGVNKREGAAFLEA